MTTDSPRVVLVVPPFQSVVRPNLGVSLLAATLQEAGVSARVSYLNMEFAQLVGVEASDWLAIEADCRALLGEWIFAGAASPDGGAAGSLPQELERVVPGPMRGPVLQARLLASGFLMGAAARLVDHGPAIIGVTSSFHQTCAAVGLARQIKALAPRTITCLGGGNCEGEMGRALAAAFADVIDHVFSGECDHAFPDFARAVLDGEPPARGYHLAPPVEDLDALPAPDFGDYFTTLARMDYADRVRPGLLYESSRGCWWGQQRHCRYCGVNGTRLTFRARSAEVVARELEQQAARWGVRRFEATDNILGPKDTAPLFDRLAARAEGQELDLFYEVRSNMSHDQLARAARGGLTWVQAGVEGLDDQLLRAMDKGVTGLDNIRFLRDCHELGVRPLWIILHNIPDEDPAAYRRMTALAPLLEHLSPPERCYPVRLDRHSPYQEQPQELGFDQVRPAAAYSLAFDFLDPEQVAGLAYYFEGDPRNPAPPEEIEALRQAVQQWQQRFFAPSGRAELTLSESMGQPLVTDSRAMADQAYRFLEPDQLQLLQAFRKPTTVERALAELDGGAAAVEQLCSWGYLVQDGDRALSVVVEEGHRIHGWDRYFRFPGGYLTREAG